MFEHWNLRRCLVGDRFHRAKFPAPIRSIGRKQRFCVGIVELLTGRPYQQLAEAWMALRGWQRGVIGTLIVLVAGFLIIVVMTAVVMFFT